MAFAFAARLFSGRSAAGLASAATASVAIHHFTTNRFQSTALAEQTEPALSPKEWRDFKLAAKKVISHNTNLYTFAIPDAAQTIGLPVASCLLVGANIGKEKEDGSRGMVLRPYTPVSDAEVKGSFDLIVKEYPDGKMSGHMARMNVGDSLLFKGPFVKIAYEPNLKKEIGMLAGGTGITPMLQVVNEILKRPEDKTKVSLIFANVSEKDILCKPEIDALVAKHPNFTVHYVVDKPTGWFWTGGVGYITKDMVTKHLPAPSSDSMIMVCGPPPMMKAISGEKAPDKSQGELTGMLSTMGYTADMVFKF